MLLLPTATAVFMLPTATAALMLPFTAADTRGGLTHFLSVFGSGESSVWLDGLLLRIGFVVDIVCDVV